MTRNEVLKKAMRGEMTWIEAAEICRITGRQMRRIKKRYEELGEAGLTDLRYGKISPRKTPDQVRDKILDLYRTKYRDLSTAHFHEKLKSEHQIHLSYNTVRSILQFAGLIFKGEKRSAHRKRRDRRPMRGMMVHMDGSTHDWLNTGHNIDLVAALDDADSRVLSARFVHQESTRSCMGVLKESVQKYGIFCSLYTDRAMHFVITNTKSKKPDRNNVSQIERALSRLGTELIVAYSPQARGRMERMWRTWQGRLPQELKLKGITTIDEANCFLEEVFIPWHNDNLTVRAMEEDTNAFVRAHSTQDLDLIFSVQTKRIVNADNTVQFRGRIIQIPEHAELKRGFAGMGVVVHEHLDGRLSITHGNYTLGRYDQNLELIKTEQKPKREAA